MLVEIWSDVVCPWCAVGKARFEQALDGWEHADDVTVAWRSFELDPRRPATTDVDYLTMLAAKYRTTHAQAQAMVDRMTAAGAAEGIAFDFARARPGNTFDAHRLLHLAAERGVQGAVKARFLAGYHSEGVPIADHAALTELAVDAGLDADEVRDVLRTDRYAPDVRRDEQTAYDLGVSGVPFFVLDRRFGVSGAQPADVLRGALEQAHAGAEDRSPTTSTREEHVAEEEQARDHEHDEACLDGACAVAP